MQNLPGVSTPTKPPKRSDKIRLQSFDDLDGRTTAYRNAVQLRDAMVDDLGGHDELSAVKLRMVESIAIMTATIEHLHTQILSGESNVDIGQLTTLTNTRNRTAQLVGLEKKRKDLTLSLTDYMKQGGTR